MEIKELLQQYYTSLSQKNDEWQDFYAENAVFSDASHKLKAEGKAAVIHSFIPFLKGVEHISIKQLIAEGEYCCAVVTYYYINPKGEKMNQDVSEVWKVVNNKLAKLSLYFDLTAYRDFMSST